MHFVSALNRTAGIGVFKARSFARLGGVRTTQILIGFDFLWGDFSSIAKDGIDPCE